MLPIRRVVLFKHGVGYFERQDEIDGDRSIDLSFKASEMNDVLKSLTVLDLDGGHVASIGYESTVPLEKRLEDVALRLPESTALTGLLEQVKGARIRAQIGSETIEGAVTGVETVWRRAGDQNLQVHHLVLLVEGGTLRSFDLFEIRSLSFLDESLKKDLGHLLEVLISGKKKDLKRLTIFARGAGKRQIVASYVIETPVWKTSYRILLGGDEPLIQGWALVDNTQDEDWTDVSLTLVAGLPVSFVHDLYSPRYQRRPVVEVVREQAYAPPVMEGGAAYGLDSEEEPTERTRLAAVAAGPRAVRSAPPPPAMAPPMPAQARHAMAGQTARVETRVEQVGDLFEYAIARPVSVGRNQSALVPILHAGFSGTKVAVYNREIRDKNPMSAILLSNTTGVTLEGGPLTVLEGERYLGESMLATMKAGETRLVPFSVELGCTVTIDHKSDSRSVHHARIKNGVLRLTRYDVRRTIYVMQSKLDAELDLFLEHRFVRGWELVETEKPAEITDSFYRFRTKVAPRAKLELSVSERGDRYEELSLSDISREKIGFWLKNRYIDASTTAALEGIVTLADRVAALARSAADHEREIGEIHTGQQRLRENLQALGSGQDERRLRERYVAELSEQEDRLRALFAALGELRNQRAAAETELRNQIGTLEFSTDL